MKVIGIADTRESLASYAAEITEPVVVIRDGKPVAALVALEDTDLEAVSLTTNPDFWNLIQRSRERHEAEGGLSRKELEARL